MNFSYCGFKHDSSVNQKVGVSELGSGVGERGPTGARTGGNFALVATVHPAVVGVVGGVHVGGVHVLRVHCHGEEGDEDAQEDSGNLHKPRKGTQNSQFGAHCW